jgi:hypothetical protein
MAAEKQVLVRFKSFYRSFNPGEQAGLPESEARRLYGKGGCEYVEANGTETDANFERYVTPAAGGWFEVEGRDTMVRGRKAALAAAREIHGTA